MAKTQVELGPDGYRLNVDGDVSEVADYGEPLEFEHGGKTYFAFMDLMEGVEESDQIESQLGEYVYTITPVQDAETVEVDGFGDEEEDEEDEEDDGGTAPGEGDEEEVEELKT